MSTLLMSGPLWAVSNAVPQELLFLEKPIDPLCFSNLNSRLQQVDLSNCGINKEQLIINGKNSHLIHAGFIGFDWHDPKASFPSQGGSYYKVFHAGENHYWIYTLNNNGGSGDFTAIYLLKVKKAGLLELTNLWAGDRCNGGIQDVKEKNHHLFFSVNMTAFDFLVLTQDNPHHLKAYDDLAACATCCVAKANYQVDSELKLQLNHVDLGAHADNPDQMPNQGRYQRCFNQLLASQVKQSGFKLNHLKLNQWISQFNKTCVESGS